MKTSILILALGMGLFAPVLAGGKKPKYTITFHAEGGREDTKAMVFGRNTALGPKFFRRSPEFGIQNFLWFEVFSGDDFPNSRGLVIKLDQVGQTRLKNLSQMRRGTYLAAALGVIGEKRPRVVDHVRIDKVVSDGVVVIWKGVTDEDIAALNKTIPTQTEYLNNRKPGKKDKKKKKSEE